MQSRIWLVGASTVVSLCMPMLAHAEEPSYDTPPQSSEPPAPALELDQLDVPAGNNSESDDRDAILAGCRLILASVAPEPPPSEAPAPKPYLHTPPQALIINEVLPAPNDGEPEWVEITNLFQTLISTEGWSIRDATGKVVSIPLRLIGKDQFVVVEISGTLLNNDKETVELVDQNGEVIDVMRYSTSTRPKKGESVAWSGSKWERTSTPTPGAPNMFPIVVEEISRESASSQPQESASAGTPPPPAPTYDQAAALTISRVYPNTTGDDETEEFIEIRNMEDRIVLMEAWSLKDASGSKWKALAEDRIEPKGTTILLRTKTSISLNNNEEVLELLRPDGSVADIVRYADAPKGGILRRDPSGVQSWESTIPKVESPPPPAQETQTRAPTGDLFEGVVTALPGVLGSQIFYVQNDADGVQVYSFKKLFPELALGDRVRIRGTSSSNRGEARLKTSKQEDITVLSHEAPVEAAQKTLAEIGEAFEGMLVQIRGRIESLDASGFTLSDGVTPIPIVLKDTVALPEAAAVGTEIDVVGIVSEQDGTYRILPRSQEDILPIGSPPEVDVPDPPKIASRKKLRLFVSGAIFSATGGSFAFLYRKHAHLKSSLT